MVSNQTPELGNEFIVVTVLLASKANISLGETITSDSLQEGLRIIGGTSANDLLAFEILWQPENEGELLSSEELLTSYPHLKHL